MYYEKMAKSKNTTAKATSVKETKVAKKAEEVKETVIGEDYEPTTNAVLLRNRYDEAMKENVEASKDEKFWKATEWKFRYVWLGGSFTFLNGWVFTKASLDNPYVIAKDVATAKALIESNKFKIVSYK